MYRVTGRILWFCLAVSLLITSEAYAWGSKPLATINDQEYTTEDFRHWWQYWNNNKPASLPDSPDGFVDFHLLAQQGQQMEYYKQPSFVHKLQVFLKVRTMMQLKYDEIDSRIKISDSEIEEYYNNEFAPIWLLQVLTYDDMDKARLAFEKMLPFKNQAAGRLFFADMQGVGKDEGGPTAYEEARVTPDILSSNKMVDWLQVVRRTEIGSVAEPFSLETDPGMIVLLRIDAAEQPPDGELDKIRKKIQHKLFKLEQNRLTNELVEKLKKKYHVEVDEVLLEELDPEKVYSIDYLDKTLIAIQDMDISVGLFLSNFRKEAKARQFGDFKMKKRYMVNSIISQAMITKESLDRGYEEKPPLKWGYEFYKQNRLRMEIEKGIEEKIEISEDEIKEYYNDNAPSFKLPEMVAYAIIQDEEELIAKIWNGVLTGANFSEIAIKYSKDESIRNVARDMLTPALGAVVDKLVKGEVSAPVPMDSGFALVKLLNRTSGSSSPLEKVRGKVVEEIRKIKFADEKKAYLQKLKSLSTVEVNNEVWEKIVKESENEKKE